MSVKFLNQGATINEIVVGGRNIVLGFPTPELYVEHCGPHFGETVGRVANRVSGAKVELNDKSYDLIANDGVNSLHGGNTWGLKPFEGPTAVKNHEGKDAVQYKLVSPEGDSGFPGTVELTVTYTQRTSRTENDKELVELEIEYEAELVGPEDVKETAINITNHTYFNLSGRETIDGTEVTLASDQYLVPDEGNIPTGEVETFPGIKANQAFTLGVKEPNVDHCFLMNQDSKSIPLDTRKLPLQLLVTADHPDTRIHLQVLSTEPAFQFYTGFWNDVPAVAGQPARGSRSGFAVEPGRFVNAINTPKWRNQMLLPKGEKFGSRIVYRAWAA
ncbi:Aldose 1-epimerase [Phytophthora infestans]|uniref:Aldose 1-epimerase n=1 Tax=Phytophthora infestans TaxID=4787 RepID=A0A833TDX8_PHYIN|nr:Aldose 1-epimerase [Phytophthora infestans]